MMALHILGLPADADEGTIRRRYLELVRKHPPERDPERFQRITAAYEAVRTRKRRIAEILFQEGLSMTPREQLRLLAEPSFPEPCRIGLAELLRLRKGTEGDRE